MDRYQYLTLMGLCLLLTLPLEFVLGARIYRRIGAAAIAIFPVVIIFCVWDVVGIARDHWSYNPRFVTGVRLFFHLPLEELVFFVVIPVCGLLTYEAVGRVLQRVGERGTRVGERRPQTLGSSDSRA